MITNEILKEKHKVQKRLSKKAKNTHDYFLKAHQAVEDLARKYNGIEYQTTTSPHHMISEKESEYNSKSGEKSIEE